MPTGRIGRLIALLALAAIATGCRSSIPLNKPKTDNRAAAATAAPEEAPVSTPIALYVCPTYGDIIVHYSFGEVSLVLKDKTVVLPQTPAADGSRYANKGNMFWEKTPTAQVSLDGRKTEMCKRDSEHAAWVDAWRRGVSFRAQGTKPAWWVDILDGDHITLTLAEINDIVRAPANPPSLKDGSRVYESNSDEGKLTIAIAPKSCKIPGNSMDFPNTVTVKLHDKTYKGCGESAQLDER